MLLNKLLWKKKLWNLLYVVDCCQNITHKNSSFPYRRSTIIGDDAPILILYKYCDLTRLNLQACCVLPDAGMEASAKNCKGVDLGYCTYMSFEEAIMWILDLVPRVPSTQQFVATEYNWHGNGDDDLLAHDGGMRRRSQWGVWIGGRGHF